MSNSKDYKKNATLKKKRSYTVVKSNVLVQQSRFHLTTHEQKIVLYLVSKIKPEDSKLMLYDFSIVEFCKVCGIDHESGANYKYIKDTLKVIADKSIWVQLDSGMETVLRWIEKPYIDPMSGKVQIKLDELMTPFLLQLKKHYTQYSLHYVLPMKSQYSIRMYELLKSYEYAGGCTLDIPELKKILDAEKYQRHADFKVNVLDIAMREINGNTDIVATYELEKEGRKFAKITFTIESVRDHMALLEVGNNVDQKMEDKKKRGRKKKAEEPDGQISINERER